MKRPKIQKWMSNCKASAMKKQVGTGWWGLTRANKSNSSKTKIIVLCANPHSLIIREKNLSELLNHLTRITSRKFYTHLNMAIINWELSSNDAYKSQHKIKKP